MKPSRDIVMCQITVLTVVLLLGHLAVRWLLP